MQVYLFTGGVDGVKVRRSNVEAFVFVAEFGKLMLAQMLNKITNDKNTSKC